MYLLAKFGVGRFRRLWDLPSTKSPVEKRAKKLAKSSITQPRLFDFAQILLAEFERVTRDVLTNVQGHGVKDQGRSVKTSSDRQIIALENRGR